MSNFRSAGGAELGVVEAGSGTPDLIWAHGWGQSHHAMAGLADGFGDAHHYLLDFPGFGGMPIPPEPWSTIEYADLAAEWLGSLPKGRRIWIGHSFGCRVGVRLASRHPGLVDGLVLVAGAGIRPPLPLTKRIQRFFRSYAFKLAKAFARSEEAREALRNKWGSADYRNAGALRPTLVRVVNEDLSEDARKISIPVLLVYGEADTETRVAVGRIFASLIPGARLDILPRYGHLDILTNGRFQVQARIRNFIRDFPGASPQ